jgi:hypothetical protein
MTGREPTCFYLDCIIGTLDALLNRPALYPAQEGTHEGLLKIDRRVKVLIAIGYGAGDS